MKCFNCGYQHLDKDNTFCPICGVELSVICNNCNSFNPKNSSFCFNCGSKLSIKSSTNDKRVQVGVIFADISGFTSLAETHTPERTKELINKCFYEITRPIYQFGGIIDKYIGDCVMAVFGLNGELDTPSNTMKCAFEMMSQMKSFINQYMVDDFISLNLTIGASYGEAILGEVGTVNDNDYTVIGDTVNIASRLQSYSSPGEIRATKDLYYHTKHFVIYNEEDKVSLKNKKDLVSSYLAIDQIYNDKSQFYIKREQATLLEEWLNNNTKHIQIYGSEGSGKSTLVLNSLESYKGYYDIHYIDVASNQDTLTYYTLEQMIKHIVRITPSDTKEESKKKLITFISSLPGFDQQNEAFNINYISILLKLPLSMEFDTTIKTMNYNDFLFELEHQFDLFMSKACTINNTLFVIDHVDKLDSSSYEFLQKLRSPNIIFIGNEILYDDIEHSIFVSPFSDKEIQQFFFNKTSLELNEEIISIISSITKGNIRYLNEISKTINQNDKATFDLEDFINDFPSTIQKLYEYKITDLSNQAKDILSFASLYNTEFSIYDICYILNVPFNNSIIEECLTLDLIEINSYYIKDNHTYHTYHFTNDLIKELLEQSLLDKEKSAHHFLIAKSMMTSKKDPSLIAHHLEHALLFNQAKEYYYKAAKNAETQFLLQESEQYYKKYLEFSQNQKYTDEIVDVVSSLAKIYINTSRFDEAVGILQEGITYSEKLEYRIDFQLLEIEVFKAKGDIKSVLPIIAELEGIVEQNSKNYGKLLTVQSTIYNMIGKPGVIDLVEKSKKILIENQEYDSLAEALMQAGIRNFIDGNPQQGIQTLEQSLQFASKTNNKTVLSKVLVNLGIFYNHMGNIEQSHKYFNDAIIILKKISNYRGIITTLINLGVSYLHQGSFNQAEETLKESLELSKQVQLPYQEVISMTNLGDVLTKLGKMEQAFYYYQESKALAQKLSIPLEIEINNLGINQVLYYQNQLDSIVESVKQSIQVFHEANEFSFEGIAYLLLANTEMMKNHLERAYSYLNQSLECANKVHDMNTTLKIKISKIELFILDKKDYSLFLEETIDFATKIENHYELSRLYYILYKHTNSNDYLKKAYELTHFYDTCFLTNEIKKIYQF